MDSRLLLIHAVVLGILVAGWLVGAVIHNNYIVRTGHGDITPGLIGLGLVLFVWGGATVRTLFQAESRARFGALWIGDLNQPLNSILKIRDQITGDRKRYRTPPNPTRTRRRSRMEDCLVCRCMRGWPRPLLSAALAILSLSTGIVNASIKPRTTPDTPVQRRTMPAWQDPISFDQLPMRQFIENMIGRLDIRIVVVDQAPSKQTVTLHQAAPGSKQELLNTFIAVLRDGDSTLVQSEGICQIVSRSRTLRAGTEPITSVSQIAPVPTATGGYVAMSYAGASLSEFCAQFADLLDITPIVINPAVQGSVNIYNSRPITREMMFPILMTVLKNNDARIAVSAGKYQVVPVSRDLPPGWVDVTERPRSAGAGTRRQRLTVGPEALETHVLSRVEPKLPVTATQQRLRGKVTLGIELNERGEIDVLSVAVPSVLALDEAVIEAVTQWRFRPFIGSDGSPTRAHGILVVTVDAPESR